MKRFLETDCVEFKRSWRDEWLKWICAFANSEGGTLYIGIDEKKREVVGVEDPQRLLEDVPNKVIASMGIAPKFSVEEREGKSVVVIEVASASYPVSYHGEFHVRVGATKQLLVGPALTQFLLDKTGRKWDGVPLDGVTVEDLDRESFAIFRRRALETGRMAEADLNVPNKLLLEKLKLMVDGKLTRAAVLLFHPDCLYLGNAGGLPKGWKVGSLFKKHTSEARNELIAGALYRGGFVETWGRGIEKVCRECERFGVSRPEYSATESDVMVCLHAREVELELSQESSVTPQETTQETAIETTQENLTPMEAQIIALIRSDAAISRKSMAERLGLTSDGVKYHLTVLKNRHVLHHEGPTKKGRWVIDSVKEGGVR